MLLDDGAPDEEIQPSELLVQMDMAVDFTEEKFTEAMAAVAAVPSGPQGAQGIQGPQGEQGAVGPAGPAGLEWKGAWAAATTYVADDAVGYGGASYFCILGITGNVLNTNPATDTTHWALLAAQGAQGQTGATGAQGPTGPQGPAGAPQYSSYVAMLSQQGTNNPTAITLQSELGTVTLTRIGTGFYKIVFSNTINFDKAFLMIGNDVTLPRNNRVYIYKGTDGSTFFTTIETRAIQGGVEAAADGVLSKTPVEIRLYP